MLQNQSLELIFGKDIPTISVLTQQTAGIDVIMQKQQKHKTKQLSDLLRFLTVVYVLDSAMQLLLVMLRSHELKRNMLVLRQKPTRKLAK
jgi:hypothetical protein